ncbi:PREDICTED: uncharacterized protein LOC104785506 [Camelina sativa]|uniref:Uncharacterized protein LOC104785506 n=1 Tax=Camelina sativa TaxID=90675 RepID=A0ABM0Z1A3_CAMSA|nr:PREDICTED: uncharacterized protein LOC104785506 [Camelina sativa]
MSSVDFLRLRPPRAPPPEPLSPPTPPEPPDPPDLQICFSFGESLVQPLNLSSFRACDLFIVPLSSTPGFPSPTDALTLLHQMFPQFPFPKFPLVWRGLDDQDLSVLQGSSSRLMVIMDAIYQETAEIVLVYWSLMFSSYDLYLIYPLLSHLLMVFFGFCCLYFLCFGCISSLVRG